MSSNVRFAEGGVREMIYIAFPMLISNACETVMVFTDRVFLSRLGSVQMSAAMSGGMSSFMLSVFFIGLIGYSTAMIAQFYGAGKKEMCGVSAFQGIIIAVLAYPLILLSRPLIHYMFSKTGIDEAQLFYQRQYFDILIFGSVLFLIRHSLSCFFSGIGKTGVVMFSSIGAMIMNVGASWVLIFGHFGMPEMGMRGAAVGTIVGTAFGISILILAYMRKSNVEAYGIKGSFRFDKALTMKLMKFGTPAGVEFLLGFTAFTFIVLIFHAQGLATATAATIMFNWDHVAFVPLLGVEIGVTSLVGRYIGAGRHDIVHKTVISGLKLGTVYSVVVAFFFVFFPYQLTEFFRPDAVDPAFESAVPLTAYMLRLASVYVLVTAQMVVFMGALRGAGDTFWAMIISVGTNWSITAATYIIMNTLHFSAKAGWTSVVLLFLLFPVLLYARYKSGRWKDIQPAT